MFAYRPPSHPHLGQLSKLTSGLTSDLAQKIVDAAEPATRRIIRDERNRLSESLIGGVAFAAGSAIAYVGTRYLVPDEKKTAKAVGYGIAALTLAGGAWWTYDHLTETTGPASKITAPGIVTDVASQTAIDIVNAAEPKIRKIVDEEKARAIEAAKAGIPLAVASLAAFFATMFLVKPDDFAVKAIGYSGTAILVGLSAYVALNKEMDTMQTPAI